VDLGLTLGALSNLNISQTIWLVKDSDSSIPGQLPLTDFVNALPEKAGKQA
jgi:hypothetical protein